MAGRVGRLYGSLRSIYRPRYMILNLAVAAIYYYAFIYLVKLQNQGVLLFSIPMTVIYALVITSSILFTIAIYSINNTRRNQAKVSASTLGVATTIAGGVIGGCGCSAPLIFGLTAIGVSASSITPLYLFLADNSVPLFSALVLVNLAVIVYYLNKLSTASCRIEQHSKRRPRNL
jgi:hypothetical protein